MEFSNINSQTDSLFLNFPMEITVKILKGLPLESLLNSMATCKVFNDVTKHLLISSANKVDLIEALFDEKFYKTAFTAMTIFNVDKTLIREKFIQKFKQFSSTGNFIVYALLAPSSKIDRIIEIKKAYLPENKNLFNRLGNLSKDHLNKLENFIISDQIIPITYEVASLFYNLAKIHFFHGLSREVNISQTTFIALAKGDDSTLFIEFIKYIFESMQPYPDLPSRMKCEISILKLAKENPFIALCELVSNKNIRNYGQIFNTELMLTCNEINKNPKLAYRTFIKNFETINIEEYLKLALQEHRHLFNLIDLITSLHMEALRLQDKATSLVTAEWLFNIYNEKSHLRVEYFPLFKPLIENHTFSDWSPFIALIPPEKRSDELKLIIDRCLLCNEWSHFAASLYCMRLLDTLDPIYQEKAINCLVGNYDYWKVLQVSSPNDLQEDLGNLIKYTLKKPTSSVLDYLNLVQEANLIYYFFNLDNQYDILRNFYRDMIDNFQKAKFNESLNYHDEIGNKSMDSFSDNENYFIYSSDQSECQDFSNGSDSDVDSTFSD